MVNYFAEAIMAAEGEEGPRLGTTHPYLGPFVRYENIVQN